jgi:DeoR/GlpR family transcriptional regulator of sugar metabolism
VVPAGRHKRLLDLVNREGAVSTAGLGRLLRVSLATIRRDLELLGRRGAIVRTHGGAVSHARSTAYEPPYRQKVHVRAEEKERIGRAAADLIVAGEAVILDSGSTCLQIARYAHGKSFTAVTLDLPAAMELADDPKVELLVVGGKARTGLYSLVGPLAEQIIGQLHVNRFFLGADAVHAVHGVTNATAAEVPVKRLSLRAAREAVLVADSSKFQSVALIEVCRLKEIHRIVTDRALPSEVARAIRRQGVRLTLV